MGADGRIAFSYVNADWRERLEPAEIIRALRGLHWVNDAPNNR